MTRFSFKLILVNTKCHFGFTRMRKICFWNVFIKKPCKDLCLMDFSHQIFFYLLVLPDLRQVVSFYYIPLFSIVL